MAHTCVDCSRGFLTELALRGHSRVHARTFEASRLAAAEANRRHAAQHRRIEPRRCQYCEAELPLSQLRANSRAKFCNSACAAKFNNSNRGPRSVETRARIAAGVRNCERNASRPKVEVVGPYCRLLHGTCAHCQALTLGSTWRKYCSEHAALYGDGGRNAYEFTFNVFSYPDVFSSEELEGVTRLGFWRPSHKRGLTRDHKVSVQEAIRQGHDPFYIKHPLNCELMDWDTNNRKKTRCSLSYDELRERVDAYELARLTNA